MADFNFNRTNHKRNRGFFVRMRFLHRHNRHEKSFCYKYFKWLLWISLSLYFFTSYLLTSSNKATTTTTLLPNPKLTNSNTISRALFETNSSFLQTPTQPKQFNDMKVYVYDLPSKYNTDWLSKRCSNHLFAAEVAIHKALLNSQVRTQDPFEADFFFVPVYVSCNFSTVNGFPAIGHARSLISSAINLISSKMPFWNRTRGSDHVFVASHDYGACFHAMEHRAAEDGVPEFLKRSIVLQTFGVRYEHPCQDVENVLIPPYIPPESIRSSLENLPKDGKREIGVFFRGKMEVNPKNVSGRYYSKKVRTVIWHKFNRHRKFYLRRERFAGYQAEIGRSLFCLCPLGWAPWSPRLVESVALGCVPVIIADGIRLPFSDSVRWPEISLTVAEKDVGKLADILEHVAATNLSDIQRNLWDPVNRRALLFNDQIQRGDATWNVLDALSLKLHRSYRRSGRSSE